MSRQAKELNEDIFVILEGGVTNLLRVNEPSGKRTEMSIEMLLVITLDMLLGDGENHFVEITKFLGRLWRWG